jgi:hypothetical protein
MSSDYCDVQATSSSLRTQKRERGGENALRTPLRFFVEKKARGGRFALHALSPNRKAT